MSKSVMNMIFSRERIKKISEPTKRGSMITKTIPYYGINILNLLIYS